MDSFSELESLTQRTLSQLSAFMAVDLGLTKFPEHLYTFLTSFFFFLAIHQTFAPIISRWSSENFRRMSRMGKNNWSIHVVSQIHALVIVPLAIRALNSPQLDKDRAFGWDEEKSGTLQAIASAYFVWDTLDAIVNYTNLGFILHGLSCSLIYLLSFSPFLSYYAARCLLWEASTIFLNIHWFLDKTNRTGSAFQLINGALLLGTFFGVRLIYGAYVSYDFFFTLYDVREKIPTVFLFIYGIGNILLQALNVIWFTKMIAALRKRFASEPKPANGNGNGNGVGKLNAKKE